VTMKMAPLAEKLAKQIKAQWNKHCDWDMLREEVDKLTGSDLSAVNLDRLTDMVKRRLPNT
jgi:hypothetical protein